jgi:hypothetical protein
MRTLAGLGRATGSTGAVTLIQRFGLALNLYASVRALDRKFCEHP